MSEILFQITCPSCETTFEAIDPELVGQIVACPKCGGMMMIDAPNAPETPGKIEEPSTTQVEETSVEPPQIEVPPVVEPPQVKAPPVIETIDEEKTNDVESPLAPRQEPLKSVWSSRIVLTLSGTICALLCFLAIRPFLSRDAEVENPPEVVREVGDVSNQEAPGELAEEETDVANLVNPNDSVTNADDVFGEADSQGVVATEIEEDASEEAPTETSLDSESVDAPTQEETDGDEVDESDATSEEETSEVEETASNSETDPLDGEDEGVATEDVSESDDALPTEFNEEEFEKANQTASDEDAQEQEEDLGSVASTTEVGLQNALPTLAREPKKIDVEARLKLPIRAITFPESPAATLRLLSEYSGVPFEIDLARFESMRSSFNATLDLTLENVDVGTALEALAKELKWNVVREEGKIAVEPAEGNDSTLIEERFDVSDLLAAKLDSFVEFGAENASEGDQTSEQKLIRLIETLVAPDAWESRGGAGRVSCSDGVLVVLQDAQNRRCVSTLLERLRAMRGLEAKDASIAETLIPETLGWERLAQKTTLNLLKSLPLQQAIEILERSQKFLVLWDDASLNESGYGRDATIAANFDSETLDRVLCDLLDPLNFSYVILGETLFLVTTKEKAFGYQTFEICLYSESEQRKTLEEATAISNEMKEATGAKTWEKPDVALWLDLETNCWLIRQSQPVQREIRRWASGRTEKGNAEKSPAP